MVSIHDMSALEDLRARWRIEPNVLRQLRNDFYKRQQPAGAALARLPPAQREKVAGAVSFHSLLLESRHDSAQDGASKLLFRTATGQLIETVILRIASGRTSLCVSSQAGCAARCVFCATGYMKQAVNLTSAEILDQVILANQLLAGEGRTVRNVVFMGMGEPLHNEAEVYPAIDVLRDPAFFGLAHAHITVSTVGIPDAMLRCAERYPRLSIALSLHSARQDVRARLMPLARHYSLDVLRGALERMTSRPIRKVMIEYLLLDGVNDTDADLAALRAYLHGLPVHVNLIPYNPINEAPGLGATPETRRRAFADTLKAAGFKVTLRYSLGADIRAACGQLASKRNKASVEA